jgi:hypothetical protein
MKFEGGTPVPLPEQKVTLRMHFSQSVTGPTEGGTGVIVRFDSTTVESPLMAAKALQQVLDSMRGLTSAIVYDDRMNVVHAGFSNAKGMPSPLAEQLGRNVKGMTFPLPRRAVGVGDSWTAEVELPMTQLMSATTRLTTRTKLTVKEIHAEGPDTTVLLAVETTYPKDPITVQAENGPQSIKLSGTLTGEQLFSVTKGAPVHSAVGGTITLEVTGGKRGGEGMKMLMAQQTSLQLSDAK